MPPLIDSVGGDTTLKEKNGELVDETLPSRKNQFYPRLLSP
jgi:hypothetical protein